MSRAKLSRREVARCAVALALLPACGAVPRREPSDGGELDGGAPAAGPICSNTHGTESDGWIAIPLADHPGVVEVGGASVLKDSSNLLQVLLIQPTKDCYAAVWEICTHGSCEVAYEPENRWLQCPCHGSRFGEDGQVIRGPAARSLTTYPLVRDGDMLWLKRR